MRTKEVDIMLRCTPIPLALLINTANSFDCDIYIDYGLTKVNVKDYAEMKKGLNTQNRNLQFSFDGIDEQAAEGRIGMLFQP
ncbi:HPr family phosphocarrier protein [Lacrimispora sp.]|uniref:HPr family phosphocarrier protein n=1 Tax=Lacrimispora sp. TaxID=2719234 RepID=UPI002FDA706B